MNRHLAHLLSRRVWPKGALVNLLGAAFLPTTEAAGCWRKWKQCRNIDNATWEEHKLLARISGRLSSIAPDCPHRPLLEGLSKAHWTQSQLMLRASARALDTLIANGIPIMLLKGGAFHVSSLENHGPRITSDLDILVRPEDYTRAIKLLYADGWACRSSVEFASARWRFKPGINLKLGPHGDVDVHHQPVHGPRLAESVLDALWKRAEAASFHGRPVLIPSIADSLVFMAAHTVNSRAKRKPGATWVFDLAMLVSQSALSPEKVVESALAFNAVPATFALLSYLQHLTNDPVLEKFLAALETSPSGWRPWLYFLWESARQPQGKRLRQLARRLPEPARAKGEYVVMPRFPLAFSPPGATSEAASDESNQACCLRHEVTLPSSTAMEKHLVLEINFRPATLARLYQFDVSMDDAPLARLSTPVFASKSAAPTSFITTLPVNGLASGRLVIEALASTNLLPEKASVAQIHAYRSVPFRVVSLSWA